MKTLKQINAIIPSSKVNMGGVILDQPLPNRQLDMVDPFLLIHHWYDNLEGGKLQQNAGVGPHPHRGFSPVTFVFKGGVHHRDSRGNDSIVMAGGVQWMEAGMGIVHSERPTKELAEKGGEFEIIQFWLNLPAEAKMGQPRYMPRSMEELPVYVAPDKKAKAYVVSGEVNGVVGTIRHPSPVVIARLDLDADGRLEFDLPDGFNAVVYVLNGSVDLNESGNIKNKSLVWFDQEGKSIAIQAQVPTRAILLAGLPLNEEVTSYGPFVMNNQTQIMQAMKDAQMGKMGVLIEEF